MTQLWLRNNRKESKLESLLFLTMTGVVEDILVSALLSHGNAMRPFILGWRSLNGTQQPPSELLFMTQSLIESAEMQQAVVLFLIRLLRGGCPYYSVRRSIQEAFDQWQEKYSFSIPKWSHPSLFFASSSLPLFELCASLSDPAPLEAMVTNHSVHHKHRSPSADSSVSSCNSHNSSPTAYQLLCQAYTEQGPLRPWLHAMALFPTVLNCMHRVWKRILYANSALPVSPCSGIASMASPLPRVQRLYLAVMASSRHQCQSLVHDCMTDFLLEGGDASWLQGLHNAPQKLQQIASLNALLAHQPWRIQPQHIGHLLMDCNCNWSVAEVVQAVLLLTMHHSLSSLIYACGLYESTETSQTQPSSTDDIQEQVQQTTVLITQLRSSQSASSLSSSPMEERAARQVFETCDAEAVVSNPQPVRETASTSSYFIRLCESSDCAQLHYVDFNVKSTEYAVFRLQDYNWEEHGCSLVQKYLPGVGDLLDAEFSEMQHVTDYSMFHSAASSTMAQQQEKGTDDDASSTSATVDTYPFRQAVWYYVLRLFGMCHDDYHYHQVNLYLNRRLKSFIKAVACYPERITRRDFVHMGIALREEEKVHVTLLAIEARKQAAVLYALNAVHAWTEKRAT